MKKPTTQIRNIGEIFSNKKIFKIPNYQRKFTWDVNESKIFINDYFDFIENELEQVNRRDWSQTNHFLGAIYFAKNSDGVISNNDIFDIVDGQQRLTTFFLLLNSILHFIHSNFILGKDISKIKRKYSYHMNDIAEMIYVNHIMDDKLWILPKNNESLRLQPPVVQMKNFRDCIENYDVHENSKLNYAKVISIFKKEFQIKYEIDCVENYDIFYTKYIDPLITKINFVVIDLESMEDAYTTFERLNDRGVRLTVFEILNIKLLSKIQGNNLKNQENQEKYIYIKNEIEDKCKKLKIKPSYALWQHFLLKYEKISKKEVPQKYSKKLKDFEMIMNELDEIKRELKFYDEIFLKNNLERTLYFDSYMYLKAKFFMYPISYLKANGANIDQVNKMFKIATIISWNLNIKGTSLGSELSGRIKTIVDSALKSEYNELYDITNSINDSLVSENIPKKELMLLPLFIQNIDKGELKFSDLNNININFEDNSKRINKITNIEHPDSFIIKDWKIDDFLDNIDKIKKYFDINKI